MLSQQKANQTMRGSSLSPPPSTILAAWDGRHAMNCADLIIPNTSTFISSTRYNVCVKVQPYSASYAGYQFLGI
jgi:hypothetical protein